MKSVFLVVFITIFSSAIFAEGTNQFRYIGISKVKVSINDSSDLMGLGWKAPSIWATSHT